MVGNPDKKDCIGGSPRSLISSRKCIGLCPSACAKGSGTGARSSPNNICLEENSWKAKPAFAPRRSFGGRSRPPCTILKLCVFLIEDDVGPPPGPPLQYP